ncbi:hypothetical protein THOM_2029 [Trachipleistophora hominis]|uniref:Uncharacterized protein n=1 Tax=Trachipleistophora hominis TaxID=72359 RepID=L7JUE9_TRAHO|nr:hypothetical protein THOM_2029 [Trachipleistophora hominis]
MTHKYSPRLKVLNEDWSMKTFYRRKY